MTAPFTSFPKIKFCGFTRPEDLRAAIDLGVDAVGFNFYPKSPRFLALPQALELARIAENQVLRIGIFVNTSPQHVAELVARCPLDGIQLHGEEETHWLTDAMAFEALRNMPVVRSIAWRGSEFPQDEHIAADWVQNRVSALLVDAHDPVQRGGTGKTARWDLLATRPTGFGHCPYLLAGGLNPENVEQAIRLTQPDGIDLASGIESSPGNKDLAKMKQVIDAATRAWT